MIIPRLPQLDFIKELETIKQVIYQTTKQELDKMAKTAAKTTAKKSTLTKEQIAQIKALAKKRDSVQLIAKVPKKVHTGLKMLRILDGAENVSALVTSILANEVASREAEIKEATGVQAEAENDNDEVAEDDEAEGDDEGEDDDEDEE